MSTKNASTAKSYAQIQCGSCLQKLPLRLTNNEEAAAVWRCADCNQPFVACCIRERLIKAAHLVRFDERYFEAEACPPLEVQQRQVALRMGHRPFSPTDQEFRRSERIPKSMMVPATQLDASLCPIDDPFSIMVVNISAEGIGFVHNERMKTEYLAFELSPNSNFPIQVIAHVIRQRPLLDPYFELGAEFVTRLGSLKG